MIHISGIVVHAVPGGLDRCAAEVAAVRGVDVHYLYPESGRLIAVQETATADEQEQGLRQIQNLPSVLSAALVEHRIDDEDDNTEGAA